MVCVCLGLVYGSSDLLTHNDDEGRHAHGDHATGTLATGILSWRIPDSGLCCSQWIVCPVEERGAQVPTGDQQHVVSVKMNRRETNKRP